MGVDQNNLVDNNKMGWKIKGQLAQHYRPSKGRRNSGLSRIPEGNPNALRRWSKVRRATLAQLKGNVIKRGRFLMRASSTKASNNKVTLWKNAPVGVYFVSKPYKRGRFTVEDIHGFVPFPKK